MCIKEILDNTAMLEEKEGSDSSISHSTLKMIYM